MTLEQIISTLSTHKPVSRRQVFRYLTACEIKPVGARQRPQQYPSDTAAQILNHLGLAVANASSATLDVLPAERLSARHRNGVASMRQLRSERKKARGGK